MSKVDADGNEIAGIRLPPVAAPVGDDGRLEPAQRRVRRPRRLRVDRHADPVRADRGVDGGRAIRASRSTSATARHAGYVAAVTAAANTLAAQRLLLPADVQAYITAAQQPVKVIGNPVYGTYTW